MLVPRFELGNSPYESDVITTSPYKLFYITFFSLKPIQFIFTIKIITKKLYYKIYNTFQFNYIIINIKILMF
jgi:hypothetical protein